MYRIKNWNEHYENNRSRKIEKLNWIPIPNHHNSEGYCEIMHHPEAAKIFAAWIIMIQVASRCPTRGVLKKDSGEFHTPRSLAIKSRAHQDWFEVAIPVLLEIGWIEEVTEDDVTRTSGERQVNVSRTSGERHPPDVEVTKKERKKERTEGVQGIGANAPYPQPFGENSEKEEIPLFTEIEKNKPKPVLNQTPDSDVIIPERLLSNLEFVGVWERWKKHRMAKKKCKDFNGMWIAQLDLMNSWGPEKAIQAMKQAIAGDWQGLHEPRVNGRNFQKIKRDCF